MKGEGIRCLRGAVNDVCRGHGGGNSNGDNSGAIKASDETGVHDGSKGDGRKVLACELKEGGNRWSGEVIKSVHGENGSAPYELATELGARVERVSNRSR